jgi:uncharacterized Zn-finger protein
VARPRRLRDNARPAGILTRPHPDDDREAQHVTAERSDKLIQPNAQHQYEVTPADLPLSCPMPGMHLWNSHPRVFLAIEQTGTAKCPYCSAEYTLKRA